MDFPWGGIHQSRISYALLQGIAAIYFDPLLAGLFGFMPALIHYVLMTMVSLTVVASFQAVGAILVIGLMIGLRLSLIYGQTL